MIRKNGDAIKEADAIGWTPLHYAALKGNLEASKLLLDVSASYMLDKSGMSALHVAAFAGHKEVMELGVTLIFAIWSTTKVKRLCILQF